MHIVTGQGLTNKMILLCLQWCQTSSQIANDDLLGIFAIALRKNENLTGCKL